jgi:fructose-1,6-bisphosphatase/inositol monophosphatase family enzyme
MDTTSLHTFITSITTSMLEAGELAIAHQGKVANLGKEIVLLGNESARVIERGQAKTEIDERVQELLLGCIKNSFELTQVSIDAEEDTPTKHFFTNAQAPIIIVIDPIDGTLEYLTGSDEYSINIGIIEEGMMLTTLVYFPKWKTLYCLDENHRSYKIQYNTDLNIISKTLIEKPESSHSNTIFVNNRVDERSITRLEKAGIKVIKDDGAVRWPAALLSCLTEEYAACIFHTPQVRDVLLGALMKPFSENYLTDWQGNKIDWPNGGRIQRAIFGLNKLPQSVLDCLN